MARRHGPRLVRRRPSTARGTRTVRLTPSFLGTGPLRGRSWRATIRTTRRALTVERGTAQAAETMTITPGRRRLRRPGWRLTRNEERSCEVSGARARQSDRRAHGLQRRLRDAGRDRSRTRRSPPTPRGDRRAGRPLGRLRGRRDDRSRPAGRRADGARGATTSAASRRCSSATASACRARTSTIASDVPIGAGLSSSAALEVAVGYAPARPGGTRRSIGRRWRAPASRRSTNSPARAAA